MANVWPAVCGIALVLAENMRVVIAVEEFVAVASLDRLEVGPFQHDYQSGAAFLLGLREKETRKRQDKRKKEEREESQGRYDASDPE